jgi:hypothetical protein
MDTEKNILTEEGGYDGRCRTLHIEELHKLYF